MQCESGWGYLVCVHVLAGLAPCNMWLAEISCWAEIVSTILGMDKINLNSSMDPRTQGFGYIGTVLTALATQVASQPWLLMLMVFHQNHQHHLEAFVLKSRSQD